LCKCPNITKECKDMLIEQGCIIIDE
jgi:hypothetical protein